MINDRMQKVAVYILLELIGSEYNIPNSFYDKIIKRYNLEIDPFTKLPCTTKEYEKLNEEYNKQIMFERFGYYE